MHSQPDSNGKVNDNEDDDEDGNENENDNDDDDDAGSESSVPTSHSLTLSPLTAHLSSPCRGIEGVRPFNPKLHPLKRKEVPWNNLQRTSLF